MPILHADGTEPRVCAHEKGWRWETVQLPCRHPECYFEVGLDCSPIGSRKRWNLPRGWQTRGTTSVPRGSVLHRRSAGFSDVHLHNLTVVAEELVQVVDLVGDIVVAAGLSATGAEHFALML